MSLSYHDYKEKAELDTAYNEMSRQVSEQRSFEWGFGRNMQGELSLGVTKNALVPASALGLQDVSTRQIASSSNHSILITSQGQLYYSGSTLHGKTGKKAVTKLTLKF